MSEGTVTAPSPGAPGTTGVVALASCLLLSGFCGIIAELSLFNLAEALLGGTNRNLTYTMGLMMFAMGFGAALTGHRLFPRPSVELLIGLELALSLLSAASVAAIYVLSGLLPGSAAWWIWTVSPLLGLLIGLEIPLVLQLNDSLGLNLRLNAALVMAPDYIGALLAFALFSFVLMPQLGLGHSVWLGGLLNYLIAALFALAFLPHLKQKGLAGAGFAATGLMLAATGWFMPVVMDWAEQLHYRDGIVWARETPYQRVVITQRGSAGNPRHGSGEASAKELLAQSGGFALTRHPGHPSRCPEDIRLYLNGGLQFSTCDEHRYHEMLVHPALFAAPQASRALVLGGGDGLAVRELLKYPKLRVDLVELDARIIQLFQNDQPFSRLNDGALNNARVRAIAGDAFRFLRETHYRYDVVVMDFPDPVRSQTARLYSTQFFRHARKVLSEGGVLVTQSFSPLYHPRAFHTVRRTMGAAGLEALPLKVDMLTFEQWGFLVAVKGQSVEALRERLEGFAAPVATRFLNTAAVQAALRWDKEFALEAASAPINDQFTLPLLAVYREELTRP